MVVYLMKFLLVFYFYLERTTILSKAKKKKKLAIENLINMALNKPL